MPPPRKHPTCGNPLFLGWIGEWLEKAKVEGPDNKMQHVFRKVISQKRRTVRINRMKRIEKEWKKKKKKAPSKYY